MKTPIHSLFIPTGVLCTLFLLLAAVLVESQTNSPFSVLLITVPLVWISLFALFFRHQRRITKELEGIDAQDPLRPLLLDEANLPREIKPLVEAYKASCQIAMDSLARERRITRNAAHQIRTSMGVLSVELHNLSNEFRRLGGDTDSLAAMQKGIARLNYIVEQTLTYSRIQSGQTSQSFKAVDLVALARNTITENYDLVDAKHQDIELLGEDEMVIQGNADLLATLFSNLVSNAVKYTPEQGRIRVKVASDDGHAVIWVEDSGPGITDKNREAVFEPFYRVGEDRHDSKVEGSGLGLSIVRSVAELHKANIKLGKSSKLGGLKVRVQF